MRTRLISVLFSLLCAFAFAQTPKYNKEYLQSQNKELKKEIAELNKILAKAKKESKNSMVYVISLDEKIKKRSKLISNSSKEKIFLEDDITSKQSQINMLNRELSALRKDYGKVLVKAYKNKNVQNKIIFVLSAGDLSQAFSRIKYLQLYSDYQNDKADEIRQKINEIEKLKASKEADKQAVQQLITQQEVEMNQLQTEKVEKNKLAVEFKKNEKQLIAQLRAKEAKSQKISAQIDAAIREEIEIARRKEEERQRIEREKLEKIRKEQEARERARLAQLEKEQKKRAGKKAAEKIASSSTSATTSSTESRPLPSIPKSDYTKLSENFSSNKGSLPSPLPGSVVVSHFGSNPHPILDGVTVKNDGVDLSGPAHSKAKAVFNGKVTGVMKIDGNLKAIVVQHGEYYTVYSNIDDPYVKQGDTVKTGQDLGHVFVNENNRSVMKVMVYNQRVKQNPASWIRL